MVYDVIMSICMNISLLIVLALMLTKIEFVKVLLLNGGRGGTQRSQKPNQKSPQPACIGRHFRIFCVTSDYIGIQVEGRFPMPSVIGVVSRVSGGPVSGMTTAVTASIHRYLIFPERISTLACVFGGYTHGGDRLPGLICKKDNRQYSNWFLLVSTFVAEAIHKDTDTDFNETV